MNIRACWLGPPSITLLSDVFGTAVLALFFNVMDNPLKATAGVIAFVAQGTALLG
jgi:hypothetical protein